MWNFGTTSFRTKQFNCSIERQLALLQEFWSRPAHCEAAWDNTTQRQYYAHLVASGFTQGSDARPDKAAREKTSGLADIGLISAGRHLTTAGERLLAIAAEGRYDTDNLLAIPVDSMLYLTQMLKMSVGGEECPVRPLIVILHLLDRLGSLSQDEFTYLAPLCTTPQSTETIVAGILDIRAGQRTIDDVLWQAVMLGSNYQEALALLQASEVSEQLICQIGINRKSRLYDRPYYPLYLLLRDVFLHRRYDLTTKLLKAIAALNTTATLWREAVCGRADKQTLVDNPEKALSKSSFYGIYDEEKLKSAFFRTLHTIKAKKTLQDYYDLNRRYLKTTGILLFADGRVSLDIVPQVYFRSRTAQLYSLAYTADSRLPMLTPLADLHPAMQCTEEELLKDLQTALGSAAATAAGAKELLRQRRDQRMQKLIDTRFTDDILLRLLGDFERRDDEDIARLTTDNADIPTIFEYVLAIAWHVISSRQGPLTDFMRLSLDADLLPVSHAAGGEADIVWHYRDCPPHYPAHDLLLEATLADGTNQRRMEMEPVSRHVGTHLLRTRDAVSYGIFVSTYLDPNVISDFKSRRHTPFVNTRDTADLVPGMKIIPVDTELLASLLRSRRRYTDLYPLFETAYCTSDDWQNPVEWYRKMIKEACCQHKRADDSGTSPHPDF